MWKLMNKPRTQRATKKLATDYASMDPAPRDRPLSERRLQVYTRLLNEGLFRPVTWASAICRETGGLYRVNGKHTSTMLAGLDEIPEFYVTLEDYECETLEDVARLYATFDSKMMSRTARDINASFAGTVPEFAAANVSLTTVGMAVSGIAFHLGTYRNDTAAERAELMFEYPEFVVWLNSIFNPEVREVAGRRSDMIRRYPVAAAMFGCWQKNRHDATTFWSAVRDETGETPNCPDRKLAYFLIRSGVNQGKGAFRVRKAEPREFYVRSIHAWNAWRKKESTDLRYHADKDIPAFR